VIRSVLTLRRQRLTLGHLPYQLQRGDPTVRALAILIQLFRSKLQIKYAAK